MTQPTFTPFPESPDIVALCTNPVGAKVMRTLPLAGPSDAQRAARPAELVSTRRAAPVSNVPVEGGGVGFGAGFAAPVVLVPLLAGALAGETATLLGVLARVICAGRTAAFVARDLSFAAFPLLADGAVLLLGAAATGAGAAGAGVAWTAGAGVACTAAGAGVAWTVGTVASCATDTADSVSFTAPTTGSSSRR